jgi:hypothetical protein
MARNPANRRVLAIHADTHHAAAHAAGPARPGHPANGRHTAPNRHTARSPAGAAPRRRLKPRRVKVFLLLFLQKKKILFFF